jgi:hypothetical protein
MGNGGRNDEGYTTLRVLVVGMGGVYVFDFWVFAFCLLLFLYGVKGQVLGCGRRTVALAMSSLRMAYEVVRGCRHSLSTRLATKRIMHEHMDSIPVVEQESA